MGWNIAKRVEGHTLLFAQGHPLRTRFRALIDARPQVQYVGWCNHNNFGDSIIAEVFRSLYPDRLVFCSYPRELLESRINNALRMRSPGRKTLVLGGGTLIGGPYLDALTRQVGKSDNFATFGTGCVEAPISELNLEAWSALLSKAQMVSVRGPRSANLCQELFGIRGVEITGDPALLCSSLYPASPRGLTRPTVGINVGRHKPYTDHRVRRLTVEVCRQLKTDGFGIAAILMHEIDRQHTLAILGEAEIKDFEILAPFLKSSDVSKIAGLRLVIAERLHASILAHSYAVPTIALGYDPKVNDHYEFMELAQFVVDPYGVGPSEIMDMAREIDARREEFSRAIAAVTEFAHARLELLSTRIVS